MERDESLIAVESTPLMDNLKLFDQFNDVVDPSKIRVLEDEILGSE
ncbi:MAG: hypothetical protein ACE5OR_16120 [bacterium]